ncbi:MAG: glucokinase [Candidatus Latescibacterota bacterium]|nr:glucokinase [Candidatus Latescibacterota bacterium]
MGNNIIFAGDVGGTKSYLGLFKTALEGPELLSQTRYETRSFPDIVQLLQAFLSENDLLPERIVLGVPGPVRQLPVKAVNLPWLIDPDQIKNQLGIPTINLLNDLEATSYGTQALTGKDLCTLNDGTVDREGNVAVIAAGTGLGEGGLAWSGNHYTAIASEGGHSTFSPSSDLHYELGAYLKKKFGHVSWERVISGPGLASIYEFLRSREPDHEPSWMKEALTKENDPSNTIARVGLNEDCKLASDALNLFADLYGCEAGNLALKLMSTGGLFLGGGIAPKLLPRLNNGIFMQSFLNKGRMKQALESIPIHVVLNDKAALLGAAWWGNQQHVKDKK